jgi:hypothetical protein
MEENMLMTQKVKLQIYIVMFMYLLDLWKAIHKSVMTMFSYQDFGTFL